MGGARRGAVRNIGAANPFMMSVDEGLSQSQTIADQHPNILCDILCCENPPGFTVDGTFRESRTGIAQTFARRAAGSRDQPTVKRPDPAGELVFVGTEYLLRGWRRRPFCNELKPLLVARDKTIGAAS